MYKILVVDDEVGIRQIIKKYATFDGYEVFEAENGLEAIDFVQKNDVDLIIMDIMMPELDGFSACREIRKTKTTPMIMLSARGEEYDRIHGFEVGADDYVVKPFSPKELMMRVDVIMRRVKPNAKKSAENETMEIDGLKVDFTARIVYVDGIKVDMSPKEYDLLYYMLQNRGKALTREALITKVWGYDYYGDDRTLDTHIKLLRKRIGDYAKFIVTLRGVGYRFEK